jgi:cyclophilin family peptidyl-prolyl cis-trans isomerase
MRPIGFLALALSVLAISPAHAQEKNPVVVMDTTMGTIKIELFPREAPITTKNFLDYVDAKFYDGTIYHRVIADFMIQGGGFPPDLKEKPTRAAIKNESSNGLANEKGTIAMAREDQPDTATAQFFINVKDNKFLDRAKAKDKVGYCVFGKVIEGMDVVDKIRQVKTGNAKAQVLAGEKMVEENFMDVPVEPVIVKSVRRIGSK